MQKEQDRSKIDETGSKITPQYLDALMDGYQPLLADEANTILKEFKESLRLNCQYEMEIDNLRACVKVEKLPEGYDVNDDATTELAVQLAQSQLETSCLIGDVVHKADLLRVAEKALEDIRTLCISSIYWNNWEYPNCARLLKQHHKIVMDSKVKAAEMRAIEYGDDVEAPAGERS